MSGWLNSDALEGTSLPTKGTANSFRDLGILVFTYRASQRYSTVQWEISERYNGKDIRKVQYSWRYQKGTVGDIRKVQWKTSERHNDIDVKIKRDRL